MFLITIKTSESFVCCVYIKWQVGIITNREKGSKAKKS